MLRDKVLDKNILPFKLFGTFDNFQKHYIIAKKTHNLDSLNYVFKELIPTFSSWDFQLKNKNYFFIWISPSHSSCKPSMAKTL